MPATPSYAKRFSVYPLYREWLPGSGEALTFISRCSEAELLGIGFSRLDGHGP